MQIRIEASDLPGSSCGSSPERPGGHHNIHVAVQRRTPRDELLGMVRGDAASAVWTIDCTAASTATGVDLKGPYVQGPPGGRFIYLSWGVIGEDEAFTMFRRAKLWLEGLPVETLRSAIDRGRLVGRLGLTDQKGNPLCASVRPPQIVWSAEAAG